MKTLEEAVKTITQFLGMQPCERSDKVPEGKSSHTLVCAGVFRSVIAFFRKKKIKCYIMLYIQGDH